MRVLVSSRARANPTVQNFSFSPGKRAARTTAARAGLFPQVHRLVDAFIRKKVKLNGCDPSELGLATYINGLLGCS